MHADLAKLSTIASALDELTERVTAMADRHSANTKDESLATGLYDVERSLQAAARRLASVMRRMG